VAPEKQLSQICQHFESERMRTRASFSRGYL
jgi:phage terminase large subunit-like protein